MAATKVIGSTEKNILVKERKRVRKERQQGAFRPFTDDSKDRRVICLTCEAKGLDVNYCLAYQNSFDDHCEEHHKRMSPYNGDP